MTFDQADTSESQTIVALVPMVDLFAVLAIVFMIYASEEIHITKIDSASKIQEVVEKIERDSEQRIARLEQESETRMQELEDKAENDRATVLAKKADISLEEIKRRQEKKARELVAAFAKMLESEQIQAAVEYEHLVTNIEYEHAEALAEDEVSLNEKKQKELEREKAELRTDLENRKAQLKNEKDEAVAKERQNRLQALAEQKSELAEEMVEALAEQQSTLDEKKKHQLLLTEYMLEEEKRQALAKAEQAHQRELAERESALQRQREEALAQAEKESLLKLKVTASTLAEENRQALETAKQAREIELAEQASALERQKERQLAQAKLEHDQELAHKNSAMEEERRQALAQSAQAHAGDLAELESNIEKRMKEDLARAEREYARGLRLKESSLAGEKRRALADAARAHEDVLAVQKSVLDAEKERAVSDTKQVFGKKLDEQKELTAKATEQLTPYIKAAEAKERIVEQLKENFKNMDTSAVEIDEKTGRVKLKFQESYFVRGSHELSEDMMDFLRIMIPKYARSIYGNQDAAKQVQSLKISGMTSPVFRGRYVDINDTSSETEVARRYNMALSNRRAIAMYEFIFDEDEMSDYPYRERLKKDMSISALGFQNATPVKDELVGKAAKCIEYDCLRERATILQFRLFSEE